MLMGANISGIGFQNPHGFIHSNTVPQTPQVLELHSKQQWRTYFEACKQSEKLMVIYFTATWCGPCKFFEPYVNELAGIYTDVGFIKIDIDKIPEAVREFDLVDVMPTFILAKRGVEIDRVVGTKNEELKTKTERHRNISGSAYRRIPTIPNAIY